LTTAALVLALLGPPIAFVCALSGINLGFWDGLGLVIPSKLLVLLLYLATGWLGIILGYGSLAAAAVCVVAGNWSQRFAVALAWTTYLVFVLFIIPLFRF
jgi:hypothetical protein